MEIEISDDDFEDANDNFGLDEFEQDVTVIKGPEPMSKFWFPNGFYSIAKVRQKFLTVANLCILLLTKY